MAWKIACAASDVDEGNVREFDIDGIEILVSKIDGELRVYPPMCPHMEEPLDGSAICKGQVMTCTKHLWQWNLTTGNPVAPSENDRCLLMYESRTDGEQLMVNIEEELEYDFDDD
jgi:toluene monooxygenase system ferredoxin subunit